MRFPIGLKIFGIAVGLLILMAAAALLSLRMTRTVDSQLAIIDQNYFPAYVALAQANIRSVEESAYVRRLLLAIAEPGDNAAKLDQLRQQVTTTGKTSDELIADARRYINRQIADPLDFDDNIALARLDDKIEDLQEQRRRYEGVLGKLLGAAEAGNKPVAGELLGELDDLRDDFDRKIDAARNEMRRLAGAAVIGTRAYQRRVVTIGVALLAIAALLGLTVAALVTPRSGAPRAPPAARHRRRRARCARYSRPGYLARRNRLADPVLQQHGRRAAGQGADPRHLRQICRSAHRRRVARPAGADRGQRLASRDDDLVLRHEGVYRPQRGHDAGGTGPCAEPVHNRDVRAGALQ